VALVSCALKNRRPHLYEDPCPSFEGKYLAEAEDLWDS